ncbi:MAG: S1-like domain-containing RNA-binding protein [Polyangiaceae bacterium]|nr:S1-like domain-containing RNA-binding protein [Polyangiaceae bacterium]
MIPVGQNIGLKIIEFTSHGAELSDGDERVLLPKKFVLPTMQTGETLTVFIYTDSEDLKVATTQQPLAQVGDFACLSVVDTSEHGAFLDWGLDKDLFVPHSLQPKPLKIGEKTVVAVYLDQRTGRVAASSRLAEFLNYDLSQLREGQEVDLVVYAFHPRGALVLVDDDYGGIVYHSETFQRISIGQTMKGYIQQIRGDNKLDIRLQRSGARGAQDSQAILLRHLEDEDGFLPLTDKSPPEAIYELLKMSKKSFKAAVGGLYKSQKINLEHDGIRLKKSKT